MTLSALTFANQWTRFESLIYANSGKAFRSFADGLPEDWEDYKAHVRKEALRRLSVETWRPGSVGKGRILSKVISAIEINEPARRLRNNLVGWQNRYGHKSRSHRVLLDARRSRDASVRRKLEDALLDVFQSRIPDRDAFDHLRGIVGDRYDLLAYLFFLKDWDRFMPIAPTVFDDAFALLDVPLITARRCSWENYDQYNRALIEIQTELRETAEVAGARLIDAHSFCWLLVRLKLPAAPALPRIPLPEEMAADGASIPSRITPSSREGVVTTEQQFKERDEEKRRLGRRAQAIALESERKRLRAAGHQAAEKAAVPVWDEPARGYDILSVEMDGRPRHIEVKAARRSGPVLSFFLTQNEWEASKSLPNYRLYLVLDPDSAEPRVVVVDGRDVPASCMAPVNYYARIVLRVSEGKT